MNGGEILKQLLLPNGTQWLMKKIHEAVNVDKSLVWEQLAVEFDAVNEIAMHESVADETQGEVDNEDANTGELKRSLTVEQEMSVEEPERKFLLECNGCIHCAFIGPQKTLNSASCLPARVQIPVPPSATSRLLYELLGRVRLGFLVVSPFRIACVSLHVERGRTSRRVWRSHRIIYCICLFYSMPCVFINTDHIRQLRIVSS
jgi:hypothetical protein